MILADVIAGLSWLYLDPEDAGRKREQERGLERLNARLDAEGASL
jgi:hypothetical protein